MEIKVTCPCGTRYKFDVEPEHERMPWPVSCPACGADGTELANEEIQQTLAAASPPPAYAPPPPPVLSAPPAGGLRYKHAAPETAGPPPFLPPPSLVLVQPNTQSPAAPMAGWKKGLIVAVTVLVVAGAGYKAYRRISKAVGAVSTMAQVTRGVNAMERALEWNLTADNSVILYIKHGSEKEVANACVGYWREKLGRNLRVLVAGQPPGEGMEYIVEPAHHGYVRLMANLEWKEPQFEDVAKELSLKFKTMVFEEKDVDASGEFVFGVFDRGTNLFHARLDMKMANGEPAEKVTLENKEWAFLNGYKPQKGEDGKTEEFNILDANELTKRFGMKFWDEPRRIRDASALLILKDDGKPLADGAK